MSITRAIIDIEPTTTAEVLLAATKFVNRFIPDCRVTHEDFRLAAYAFALQQLPHPLRDRAYADTRAFLEAAKLLLEVELRLPELAPANA